MKLNPSRLMSPWLAWICLFVGCGSIESEPMKPTPDWRDAVKPGECNPIAAEWDCLMPYPCDAFRQTHDKGYFNTRIILPAKGLPHTADGKIVDPLQLHPADGFSVLPQIAVRIPGGIQSDGLIGAATAQGGLNTADYAATTLPANRTLLMDAGGGLVPHLAEIDPRPASVDDRVLLIRPLVRLADGATYIVALRRKGMKGGLIHADGSPIARPAAFAAIVDKSPTRNLPLSEHYEERVLAPLAKAGIARGDLLLAWDFTTRSEWTATQDMTTLRKALLTRLIDLPPAATVTSVVDPPGPIARRIEGVMTVPLYLQSDLPGALLHRDPFEQVTANGTTQVPFTILVPEKALVPGNPGRLLQFGHGFFGSRDEITSGFVPAFAAQTGMVVMAVDWWGMSKHDVSDILGNLISNPALALRFTDRLHQAMANQIALSVAARTTLKDRPELQVDGKIVYDPAHLYFYGISLGHILGGTYIALGPHVEKAVLSVGGAGFAFMMSRARPFGSFLQIIEGAVGSPQAATRMTLVFQTVLDRIDPITYAPWVRLGVPGDALTARQVLMQIGLSDTQVPNLTSHVHARALGLTHLQPSPRGIFGLTSAGKPAESALVEFDFGIAAPDVLPVPVENPNPVHEGVRMLKAAMQQADDFLKPGGKIAHTCSGVCDPE